MARSTSASAYQIASVTTKLGRPAGPKAKVRTAFAVVIAAGQRAGFPAGEWMRVGYEGIADGIKARLAAEGVSAVVIQVMEGTRPVGK